MDNTVKRPNVLFIMDDQHRFDYLGCAGAGFVSTPNIDRLAARGVRFANCCTNAPLCVPARIGLAAGIQPANLGSLNNQSFLPQSAPTHYQHFRDAGYRVACVGKLDLAKPDSYNGERGDRPCVFSWGFTHPEEDEGKMHAGNHPTPLGPYGMALQQKGLYDRFHEDYRKRASQGWNLGASHDSVLPTEDFEDVYIARRAADWIRTVPDDFPFYCLVSFVGPHDPFDPPAEYADRYREADTETLSQHRPLNDPAPASVQINKWYREGSAAGNTGDLYHNHDHLHLYLKLQKFPQVTPIDATGASRSLVSAGLQYRKLFTGRVIGNASMVAAGVSLPEWAYRTPRLVDALSEQYANNHVYLYPSHKTSAADYTAYTPTLSQATEAAARNRKLSKPFLLRLQPFARTLKKA